MWGQLIVVPTLDWELRIKRIINDEVKIRECEACGHSLSTEELQQRFLAGLGYCPGCKMRNAEWRVL
jgi:Zn ribbon nucleic-acid-binding protein